METSLPSTKKQTRKQTQKKTKKQSSLIPVYVLCLMVAVLIMIAMTNETSFIHEIKSNMNFGENN